MDKITSFADAKAAAARAARDARLIWVCNCRSTSFYLGADGSARCQSCDVPVNGGPPSNWREMLPETPSEPAALGDGGEVKVIQLDSQATWLRRRIADQPQTIVAVVALYRDGRVATFAEQDRLETPEQLAWLDRKFAEARDRLLPKGT